ncbi:MAG: hypothetical protein U5L96_20880 [Owenweeksia sp.]|nr:hypothetical protein [Owenweeksia sp.]
MQPGQGGFAASGTSLKTFGKSRAVIGLGGKPNILITTNRGQTWRKTSAPLDSGSSSRGLFSFDFVDAEVGFCVGGDYRSDSLTTASAAITTNGGLSWQPINDPAISGHYRSCVVYLNKNWLLAVSRTGCSFSSDGGMQWRSCPGQFYSLSVAGNCVWASGANGQVARWQW